MISSPHSRAAVLRTGCCELLHQRALTLAELFARDGSHALLVDLVDLGARVPERAADRCANGEALLDVDLSVGTDRLLEGGCRAAAAHQDSRKGEL